MRVRSGLWCFKEWESTTGSWPAVRMEQEGSGRGLLALLISSSLRDCNFSACGGRERQRAGAEVVPRAFDGKGSEGGRAAERGGEKGRQGGGKEGTTEQDARGPGPEGAPTSRSCERGGRFSSM